MFLWNNLGWVSKRNYLLKLVFVQNSPWLLGLGVSGGTTCLQLATERVIGQLIPRDLGGAGAGRHEGAGAGVVKSEEDGAGGCRVSSGSCWCSPGDQMNCYFRSLIWPRVTTATPTIVLSKYASRGMTGAAEDY